MSNSSSATIDKIFEVVTTLQKTVTLLQETIIRLDQKVSGLEQKVSALDQRVAGLEKEEKKTREMILDAVDVILEGQKPIYDKLEKIEETTQEEIFQLKKRTSRLERRITL